MTDGQPGIPLCFVLMPFGTKLDPQLGTIDFDAVYRQVIAPAVALARMEPIRADQEVTGGIIHKPMFERLMLCEYGIADLTSANANVFYELGIRHAVRPWSTVLLFAEGGRLPFDVALDRAVHYRLDAGGQPVEVESAVQALAEHLKAARKRAHDSPIFQLIPEYPQPNLENLKPDVFAEQAQYSEKLRDRIASARVDGSEALHRVEAEIGSLEDVEASVAVDLLTAYRAHEEWNDMIRVVESMPPEVANMTMVREQYGFALNRGKRPREAEQVLTKLIRERGPSGETYGILGRVYKDRWEEAAARGDSLLAAGYLDQAIEAYRMGFESDWRDAYPGINAVTLMEVKDPPDPLRERLLPVVAYAVEQKLAAVQPGYWDHATRLELAVLGKDEPAAMAALTKSVVSATEPWQLRTTARNLCLIREARRARGEVYPWADQAEAALDRRAVDLAPQSEDDEHQ